MLPFIHDPHLQTGFNPILSEVGGKADILGILPRVGPHQYTLGTILPFHQPFVELTLGVGIEEMDEAVIDVGLQAGEYWSTTNDGFHPFDNVEGAEQDI